MASVGCCAHVAESLQEIIFPWDLLGKSLGSKQSSDGLSPVFREGTPLLDGNLSGTLGVDPTEWGVSVVVSVIYLPRWS